MSSDWWPASQHTMYSFPPLAHRQGSPSPIIGDQLHPALAQ